MKEALPQCALSLTDQHAAGSSKELRWGLNERCSTVGREVQRGRRAGWRGMRWSGAWGRCRKMECYSRGHNTGPTTSQHQSNGNLALCTLADRLAAMAGAPALGRAVLSCACPCRGRQPSCRPCARAAASSGLQLPAWGLVQPEREPREQKGRVLRCCWCCWHCHCRQEQGRQRCQRCCRQEPGGRRSCCHC